MPHAAMTRDTATCDHVLPFLSGLIPRAFSAWAILRIETIPAACISRMTGRTSAWRCAALARRAFPGKMSAPERRSLHSVHPP